MKSEGKGGGNWGECRGVKTDGRSLGGGGKGQEVSSTGGGHGRGAGAYRSGVRIGKAVGEEELCVSHVGGGSRMLH